MTKNVATVEGIGIGSLIATLSTLGYAPSHPTTGEAQGYTSGGEGPVRLASSDVSAFLVEGNGVVLWRSPTDTFYLSLIAGKPRIIFDGLTTEQEALLRNDLRQLGLTFSVAHEDAAYEA